jgi:hypothetical protein
MNLISRHTTLFNQGVRSGDFGPWLDTFHEDAVATFTGLPFGPVVGRDAIGRAYAEHLTSSTMSLLEATVKKGWRGDVRTATARFVWDNAPDTGGRFLLRLRKNRLTSIELTLDAPPPLSVTATGAPP